MISISPQAVEIYRLLSKEQHLTAKEIADKLNIFPNAVYRSTKVLTQFGFIEQIGKYPIRYTSRPSADGLDSYTQSVRKTLLNSLSINIQNLFDNEKIGVLFINNRTHLIERSNTDTKNAIKDISLIVSGLEVPADTILEYKRAIDTRGVRMRVIVQKLDEAKETMLKNWQKMGIEVRHYPLIEARIIIFDSKIAYITSYNLTIKEESNGVRFNYAPIAQILQDLFEQRWTKSKPLT